MINLVKQKKPKEDKKQEVKKNKQMEVEKPQKTKQPEKPAEKIQVKKEVGVSPQASNTLMNILWLLNDVLVKEKDTFLKLIKIKEGSPAFDFDVKPGIKIFGSKPGTKGDYYSNYVMLLFGKNKATIDKTTMH